MTGNLAKRPFLTLGFVVCGLVSLAACGAAGATTPLTASGIISKAQSAHPKDATFTLNYTINGTSNGTTINSQLTGSGELTSTPPRSHLTLSGTVIGQTITSETITDGTTEYNKTTAPSLPSDGKWTKTTVSSTDPSADLSFSSLYTGIKNPKLIGTETVNGNNTYHISGTPIEDTPAAGTPAATSTTTSTEDVWIRTDNFYPAKFSITGSDAAGSGIVDIGTSSIVITFTKWDSGVTITVPSPDQVSSS